MNTIKKVLLSVCLCTAASLSAVEAGVDIHHDVTLLEEDDSIYTPDTLSAAATAFFCHADFSVGNHSFLIEPGLLIKNNTVRPFLRKGYYSLFTDTLTFSIGKNTMTFGEGIIKNYFFVHIPQAEKTKKKKDLLLWYTLCEMPIQQFLLTAGSFCDTDSLDAGEVPRWYSLWAKAAYSHPAVFAGVEADVLFQPKHSDAAQKEAYRVKAAAEVSTVLPYLFKLYTNAQLPVDILNQKVDDWGVLAGASKSFIFNAFTVSAIAEAAYSKEGFEYGLFQNTEISDYVQLFAGIQGLERSTITGMMQTKIFISNLTVTCSYTTKNLIEDAADSPKKDSRYIGTLSISLCLGGGL